MKAVILAAGKGTRMGDLTRDRQKVLLKRDGKDLSMLEHNLRELPDEIDEVILVVGYMKKQVADAVGEEYAGRKIAFVEQDKPKGTGHALSICRDYLQGKFLVLMGDDFYLKEDLERLIENDLGILVLEVKEDNPDDFNAPIETDDQGNALKVVERQHAKKGMLINTGAYVLDERYFDLSLQKAGNKTEEYGLPQTFMQLSGEGIKVVKATSWHRVTSPEDLK